MSTDSKKSVTAQTAVRTLLAGSLVIAGGIAQAAGNPFTFTDLPDGYRMAEADKADDASGNKMKKGEGKCGGKSASEAVCGMYQVGSSHKDPSKVKDGKCGGHKVVESMCGGDR